MKAKASAVCSKWLKEELNELHKIALYGDKSAIVGKMMQIVEEYVPQNSIFAMNNGNGSGKHALGNVEKIA